VAQGQQMKLDRTGGLLADLFLQIKRMYSFNEFEDVNIL
jgi:hypothetical protein